MDGGPSNSMGGRVSALSLTAHANNPLEERWRARTIGGNLVASLHESIDHCWTVDAAAIGWMVWRVAPASRSSETWTDWQRPTAKAVGDDYEIRSSGGQAAKSDLISSSEQVLYEGRYKRMRFPDYLENMPKANGPTDAWTQNPIPASTKKES